MNLFAKTFLNFHIPSNLLIIVIVSLYLQKSLAVEIPVCCPKDFVLTKTINGEFTYRVDKYLCTNRTELNDQFLIDGLRIPLTKESNIPVCDAQNLIKLTDEVHMSSSSCVSNYLNETYVITCPLKPTEKTIIVNVVKKCCPFGKLYDKKNKRCIDNDNDLNIFNRYFDRPIVFKDDPLKCPEKHEIIVEYFSKFHDFVFEANNLILSETNELFNVNSYCVEAVFDIDEIGNVRKMTPTFFDHQPKISFMVRTCNLHSICNQNRYNVPCIRRCCQDKEKLIRVNNTPICTSDLEGGDLKVEFHGFETRDGNFFADVVEPKAYGTIFGQTCKKYKLNQHFDERDVHYINYQDGSLHLPQHEENQKTFEHSDYCIEKYEYPGGQELLTFLCFQDPESDRIKFSLYSSGILISCIFFMLTLLVYLCIPKFRNLPGKILICLVLSLLVAYLGIAIGQLSPQHNEQLCYYFAFFVYFSMMAAFSWMNIMCFDIWLTFGSTQRSRGMPFDKHDLKRFLLYSLYGWGMPTLITTFTICITRYNLISEDLQPKFGEGRCWFQYAHAASHLIFFLGPVGVLFLINFVLFVLTLKYCNQVKREIHRMQSMNADKPLMKMSFGIDKERFMMNTKLFIVMGITWVLEILSTLLYNRNNMFFWIISDLFNILQGVLVFFIFVFKWRVWYAVLDRFGIKYKKQHKRGGATMATTSTFTGSTGNLTRLKSMESCSSLLNTNVANNARRLSPIM